jgi:integrase
MISANPADRATPPRWQRPTVNAPAVPDVLRLIGAAELRGDSILATAIALAAVTGCRRGELCALRWSDVDRERNAIRVSRSLTVIRTNVAEGPTKTHAHRWVAIDAALAALLAKRRAGQEHFASRVGTALPADAYVLSRSPNGLSPCKPDGLTQAYVRVAKSLGLSGHFHELRHFAATVAIASGADVRTVAGRLGHADPSVTLRVYSHALEARHRALAGVLGQTVLAGSHHHDAAPVEH